MIRGTFEVFAFITIVTAVAAMQSSFSSGGACEKIENFDWGFWSIKKSWKTCFVESSAIDSTNYLITSAREETVEGFSVWQNKKVQYLPKNAGEKFPNLIGYDARDCSIKEISKEDFKGLYKLQSLYLNYNQIEKINDDTFEYIPGVHEIWMARNKIKQLNGRAFASLNKLTSVWLNNNECINEDFSTEKIAEMSRILNGKCGFTVPKACGVPKKARGTMVRGEKFDRGDFPWMVALYRIAHQTQAKYFCGGSVISNRHVLTAAHCLDDLVARDITAVFGAYDLDNYFEDGRFTQSPSRIFVHEHWNPRTTQFDADIAMLLMSKRMVFSRFVQPVCLGDLQTESTAEGIVAGWGQSQNRSIIHETIPTMLQLPIHSNEDCFLAFPRLAEVSSKQTFCAGSADGRGPCLGDSGGGFVIHAGKVFYLKGIVSAAWDVNVYGECLLKMYTIYTDVLKFKTWIDTTMQSSLVV